MPRSRVPQPRAGNDSWPGGRCEDPDAEAVRLLVQNVGEAREVSGLSVRALAREAGFDHGVLSRLLAGESWPEVTTVLRLERALGERLWPDHLELRDQ